MWDEICIQRHTQQNRIRTEQKWQRTLEMFRWEKLLLAGENVVALTRIHLIRIIMTATKRQWKAPHLYLSPFAPPLSVSRLASWEYDGSMPNRIHLVHTFPWEIYFVRLLFVRSFFFLSFHSFLTQKEKSALPHMRRHKLHGPKQIEKWRNERNHMAQEEMENTKI